LSSVGVDTLGLAPQVSKIYGLDVSPALIERAMYHKANWKHNTSNVTFIKVCSEMFVGLLFFSNLRTTGRSVCDAI
jgi:tRNA/tmRNA/rRNA uracil-C5-methylase (TrmA/RlmC/RlmD family)